MYNRYVRNDWGSYQRIPVQEDSPPREEPGQHPPPPPRPPPPPKSGGDKPWGSGFFSSLLEKLHLSEIDTGDLLLLAIIFLLFKDGEDDELLIALGLLLIL